MRGIYRARYCVHARERNRMVARHLKGRRRLTTLYYSCNLVAVHAERAALSFGYIKAHRNRVAEQYLSAARHRLPVHACRNAAGKR